MTSLNRNSGRPESNPIAYRLRRDIVWKSDATSDSDQQTWIAEDPMSRRLFRCGEHEYQLLQWLDGVSTAEQIAHRFTQVFAPRSISTSQVLEITNRCLATGLMRPVVFADSGSPEQCLGFEFQQPKQSIATLRDPSSLAKGCAEFARRIARMIQCVTQIQWSLGSPDPILKRIQPWFDWLYSSQAVAFWISAFVVSLGLVVIRIDQLLNELPEMDSLRSPGLLIGYGVVFVLTRFVHELGHAIVCKRSGAACRDVGLMMSYGMLCPYVDITDAWRVGNRYTRMQVALAGVYSEAVVACVSAWIWCFTHPGWMHDVAFQTMLVCSVTAVLFNANPLLKYDGYFVLCDLLNMQNLRERSFRTLDAALDRTSTKESSTVALFLSIYFVASTLNRILVTCGIVSLVYFVFSQWQLTGIGIGLICISMTSSLILSVASWTKQSLNRRQLGSRVMWLGWSAVCLLIAWAINMPLPNRVRTTGEFHVGDSVALYATASGRIVSNIQTAQPVVANPESVLIQQRNERLERSIMELEVKRLRLESQLKTMQRKEYFEPSASEIEPWIRAQLTVLDRQLDQRFGELSRLRIVSDRTGFFIPAIAAPAQSPENPSDRALELDESNEMLSSTWTDKTSIGRHLDRGTLIGWMVQEHSPQIECRLTEDEKIGIDVGTEARIRIIQSPTQLWIGRVADVTLSKQTSEPMKENGLEEMTGDKAGYRVRIHLDSVKDLTEYMAGTAEVVFVRPNRSLLREATDFWTRNVKLR